MTSTLLWIVAAQASLLAVLERVRLRLHFIRVGILLGWRETPPGLGLEARAHSLALLREYGRAGRFPLHGGAGKPRPVFVDHQGTHCAVGHLLARCGQTALVGRVAERSNFAFLADMPDVSIHDLAQLGITLEEAALIQPSYSWGPGPGNPGVPPGLRHVVNNTGCGAIALLAVGVVLCALLLTVATMSPARVQAGVRSSPVFWALLAVSVCVAGAGMALMFFADLP